MVEPHRDDAADAADDATVREEWRRLERQRLDEEIAEAREDAVDPAAQRHWSRWLAWIAFAVALVAGIAVAIMINSRFDPRR